MDSQDRNLRLLYEVDYPVVSHNQLANVLASRFGHDPARIGENSKAFSRTEDALNKESGGRRNCRSD